MSKSPLAILLLGSLALFACAHAPQGVQGGALVPYARFTSRPDRVFTAGACQERGGAPAQAPAGVEYEVRKDVDQPALVEHTLNEPEARLIRNTWADGDGRHFFVWLKDASGFEYVVRQQAEGQVHAERRVYVRPQVRRVKLEGRAAVQPVGQASVVCELLPQE